MKRTPEDDNFIREFSRYLREHYDKRSVDITDEMFAKSVGVSRPGLQKYLDGKAMPSVRTVVLSYINHNIRVPYLGINIFGDPPIGHAKNRRSGQLTLPLAITALHAKPVGMKLDPKGINAFELRITLQKSG